ncbi:MAG: hypothetical protein ONB24_13440 [candidate division KSB1 bacterium]|nr:hypothetical protein [candidate division KSB1 bacterium]
MSVYGPRIALPYRRREKLNFTKKAALALAVFTVYNLVNVWQNVNVSHLIRRNEELRRELNRINRRCNLLEFELEQMKDPENIRRVLAPSITLRPAETITLYKGGKQK